MKSLPYSYFLVKQILSLGLTDGAIHGTDTRGRCAVVRQCVNVKATPQSRPPEILPAKPLIAHTLCAEMPGPPTNIAISNIGPRTVTLQFKPGYDGKTSISRWQVEAQVQQT